MTGNTGLNADTDHSARRCTSSKPRNAALIEPTGGRLLEDLTYSPTMGKAGDDFAVTFRASKLPEISDLQLCFGMAMLEPDVSISDGWIVLRAQIPAPDVVNWPTSSVPIHIVELKKDAEPGDCWNIGEFVFENNEEADDVAEMDASEAEAIERTFVGRLDAPSSSKDRKDSASAELPAKRRRVARVAVPPEQPPATHPTAVSEPSPSCVQPQKQRKVNQIPKSRMPSYLANQTPEKLIVSLRFESDFRDITADWTNEEKEEGRRLVLFKTEKSATEPGYVCTFRHIPTKNCEFSRLDGDVIVSCMFWAEKNEYFITSVDMVYLLEKLMVAEFNQEDKNRIRRNLEGFDPQTVAKGKLEHATFFQMIMGFPDPRPRNIEKDVKVFPWSFLLHAIRKVIQKYQPGTTIAALHEPLPPPSSAEAKAAELATLNGNHASGMMAHMPYMGGAQNEMLFPFMPYVDPTFGDMSQHAMLMHAPLMTHHHGLMSPNNYSSEFSGLGADPVVENHDIFK